jgi:hypothetical protein
MRAALLHVDRFLPGQNLLDLEALAEVLPGIDSRHAAKSQSGAWRHATTPRRLRR